jgi:hypothetical protein
MLYGFENVINNHLPSGCRSTTNHLKKWAEVGLYIDKSIDQICTSVGRKPPYNRFIDGSK